MATIEKIYSINSKMTLGESRNRLLGFLHRKLSESQRGSQSSRREKLVIRGEKNLYVILGVKTPSVMDEEHLSRQR